MIERHCSVRKTVEIVLDSWTFLIIREAFFGVHSFDKLQRRLGIPRQTLSTRLAALVENSILLQARDAGERPTGYHFTKQGKDLFASMLSLMEFGDKWLTRGDAPPLSLTHTACGHACNPTTVCSECREPINAKDVAYRDGPARAIRITKLDSRAVEVPILRCWSGFAPAQSRALCRLSATAGVSW